MDLFSCPAVTDCQIKPRAELATGEQIKRYGGSRVLVLCPQAEPWGLELMARVEESLSKASLHYCLKRGSWSSAACLQVQKLLQEVEEQHFDFLLAVGGGNTIDCAKVIAAALGSSHGLAGLLAGQDPDSSLPVGVILTCPSGSVVSNLAFMMQDQGDFRKRCCFISEKLRPRFALINPEVQLSLSPYQTACGVAESLGQAVARYFSCLGEGALSDRLLEGLMVSLVELAPRVLAAPDNYELRANLSWAAVLAQHPALECGRGVLPAALQLAGEVCALYNCQHGAAVAVLLPAWLELMLQINPLRSAQFAARVFGISLDFEEPQRTARVGVAALKSFFAQLGLPRTLSELGLSLELQMRLKARCAKAQEQNGRFAMLKREECEVVLSAAAGGSEAAAR